MFSGLFSYLLQYISHPLFSSNIALLNPQGTIAYKEFNLMLTVLGSMVVIVIAVFAFTFLIVWKFRVTNPKDKKYNPDWDHNPLIEFIWWIIPLVIVIILSVITWQSSHDLDPYKPLDSVVKPVTIQVVALDWKWLFIYPDQGIATVNMVEFPAGTPINFQITADAPMNSFWIPQLAGQIYAMPGMTTQLHLDAFKPGTYNGLSANISGAGFAGMKFVAKSVSQSDFDNWVTEVQNSSNVLDDKEYAALSEPSQNNPVALYSSIDKNLYNEIVMKFMMPMSTNMPEDMSNVATISTSSSTTTATSTNSAASSTATSSAAANAPATNMQNMPGM